MKLILGSSSLARQRILREAGYEFEVIAPDIDEKSIRDPDPVRLTTLLAKAKAKAILSQIKQIKEEAILITSDQVVLHQGAVREKPLSRKEAFEYLETCHLAHEATITSVCVTNTKTGKMIAGTDVSMIWFRQIPDNIINDYLDTEDAFSHAGGFDHEHPLLAPFVKEIKGTHDSIAGLPMALTIHLIEEVQKKEDQVIRT